MRTPETSAKFLQLSRLLVEGRRARGIAQQADLAAQIGVSQQSVSRWEAGSSRPRVGQIESLAAALKVDDKLLLAAAGYGIQNATLSIDVPLPLENLLPHSFERFAGDFLAALYPGARVHLAGGNGHKQDGIDVTVSLVDGKKITVQCKQVQQFGPKMVERAIASDITSSERKVLLISRIASPDARAVIAKSPIWDLWDRDDVSAKFRELPFETKTRLVRTYFKGSEFALLGTELNDTWDTVEEFYAPFDAGVLGENGSALFTHSWELSGHAETVEAIKAKLTDDKTGLVVVAGPAGAGKSRVLKEVLRELVSVRPLTQIRIANATGEITKSSLDQLPQGDLVLVVDDGHDRSDLPALLAFAAIHSSRVRIVISTRSYGVARITADASGYSFSEERLAVFALAPLTEVDTLSLAIQVLEHRNSKLPDNSKVPLSAAKDIAKQTGDNALMTVMAAQIVASKGVHPAFVTSDRSLMTTVLARFEEIITGKLSETEDAANVRRVLGFLALVQPIRIDDDNLISSLKQVDGIEAGEVHQIIRLLIEANVLFKRGSKYRLAPDALSDHLIETRFTNAEGGTDGYALKYFEAVPEAYIENLLVNLGRVDWRLSQGSVTESPVLDSVWSNLEPRSEYSDVHIQAVQAVAYYQPKRALAFVVKLIRSGKFLSQLPDIAKYAAYSDEHRELALDCLWALGKDDGRETNPHPSHAVRILSDMVKPETGKPLSVCRDILDFAIKKARGANEWNGINTPLDFADAVLATEGHTNSYSKFEISMSYFGLRRKDVAVLRERYVDFLIELLVGDNLRAAVRAGQSLAHALRRPMGMFGAVISEETLKEWDVDFQRTLRLIAATLESNSLDPLVQTEIKTAVSWLAGHAKSSVAQAAQHVITLLSSSLDARLDRVLLDGYGHQEMRANSEGYQERWSSFVDSLVADFEAAYPDASARLAELERRIARIAASGSGQRMTIEILGGKLIDGSQEFALAVLSAAEQEPNAKLNRFAGHSLGRVFRTDRQKGRDLIRHFMEAGRDDLLCFVGHAYQMQRYGDWFVPEDEVVLNSLLKSEQESVVLSAVRATRYLAEFDKALAYRLVMQTNIVSTLVADELAALFEFRQEFDVANMTPADLEALLNGLQKIPELDGYWIDKLLATLSEGFPWQVARFLMRRVDHASSSDREGRMRPVNYGPWAHEKLRFRSVPEGDAIMREVVAWMIKHAAQKGMFGYWSRNLFQAMFAPFDKTIVGFLRSWLPTATENDIRIIAEIVREADREFIFNEMGFVTELLACAQRFGEQLTKGVSSELYCSAMSGMRSGTPGQPFSEDLTLRDLATEALLKVDRFSHAYELYEAVRDSAIQAINRQMRDAEDD